LLHRLVGTQQEKLDPHSCPTGQPARHVAAWPQLLVVATPPHLPAHGSADTQHVFSKHTLPVGQLLAGQGTCWSQLFITVTSQRLPHAAALFGTQQAPLLVQIWLIGQADVPWVPQLMSWPQLFVAWLHSRLPQAAWSLSGTQLQALSTHAPPSQLPQ
jgi:hypothetical protein